MTRVKAVAIDLLEEKAPFRGFFIAASWLHKALRIVHRGDLAQMPGRIAEHGRASDPIATYLSRYRHLSGGTTMSTSATFTSTALPNRCSRLLVALVLSTTLLAGARAQDAPPKAATEPPAAPTRTPPAQRSPDAAARNSAAPAQVTQRQLPADSTTSQSIDLPGRTLKFKATAGSIPLTSEDGRITAEIAYISYQLEGTNSQSRPVAFLFNGGPGSASAWVHIVGFGPWRLPAQKLGFSPSAQPSLIPNAETWLDFADLVFIDPAGTGFSRIARQTEGPASANAGRGDGDNAQGQAGARYFYSVGGDAESVSNVIAKWLRNNDRLASPKVLVGESYGGIRAPKVAQRLQTVNGIGMSAMILISPVMDFGLFRGPRHHLSMYVQSLPTIAAAAREAKGQVFKTREELAEVENYARTDYLLDLMRGPRDGAALDRIVKRVAGYSGLSEAVVRQYGGRLDEFIYIREANRAAQRQASGYDTTITGDDAEPTSYFPRWDDPLSTALNAPVTSAMLELYGKLGWKTDLSYNLASTQALRSWQWGNSSTSAESFTQIEAVLALDPRMRLLVTHGATDLRTPYLGSVLLLEQLPAYADKTTGRVTLRLFPGGHMHYTRDGSRRALRDDVKALIETAVAERMKPE